MGEKAIKHGNSCIYEIDTEDRIVFCNGVWDAFAVENGGEQLRFEDIKGRVLWDFLDGASTIDVYTRLISHVREGNSVKFMFRSDSPSIFRLMEMKIALTSKNRVRFSTRIKSTGDRESLSIQTEETSVPDEPPLLVCSWCGRLKIHRQSWQQIDIAVSKIGLFEKEKMPSISHGICERCLKEINSLLRT